MEELTLSRDVVAIQIPSGEKMTLDEGTDLYMTQALGGSFTVQVPLYGGLFRISGRDADAIGKEVPEEIKAVDNAGDSLEEKIEAALKSCYDPEIPVNIVDLGLVYDTRVAEDPDSGASVNVKMTLTAVGCGMGASIAADAEERIREIEGVADARVDIVWDPPWSPQMISEEGRKKLGIA